MCLIPSKIATEAFLRETTEPVKAYKVVRFCDEGYFTSIYVTSFVYSAGDNIARDHNGQPVQPFNFYYKSGGYGNISCGIHVCLTLKEVQKVWTLESCNRGGYAIIPVWCDPDDLVAVGRWSMGYATNAEQAVFTKVCVEKEDITKALNEINSLINKA